MAAKVAAVVCCLVAASALQLPPPLGADGDVTVSLDGAVFVVSDKYLSVTIDAGSVNRREWQKFNFTTPRMQNLAQALKPATLRVGGTSQDYLIFQKNNLKVESAPPRANFSMTTGDWDAMNEFVRLAGWEFIFGLNLLLRNHSDGSWNTSNARDLMEYTLSKGYDVKWELGNEPDLFPGHNVTVVKAEQLAKDFEILQELIAAVKLKTTTIAGPDVATLTRDNFYNIFLSHIKPGLLSAVTWHHYYLNGAEAVLPQMWSSEVLDKFIIEAEFARDNSLKHLPTTELWLGETSSCYGGGTPILSGSYVSGFMWLDKLGVAARTNHSRVLRQDYIGGSYSLLDASFDPLPDYWLSVLHKRLVEERVLHVDGGTDLGRKIRVYAHCARQPLYPAGDVVLFLINTHTYDTSATLKTSALASAARDVYWLAPPDNPINVLSKEVALNGKVLMLVDNTTLPELPPLQQEASDTIKLPALTFGFYVFKDVKAKACM